MTRWARLTWQSADPAALAAALGRALGLPVAQLERQGRSLAIGLGTADLELVAWRPETAADVPRTGGRLVFEPIEGGADDVALAPAAMDLAAVAWATVELDRAEAELGAWLAGPPAGDDRAEPHLGARARVRGAPALPGSWLVLCEPATEGRLAASLARDGEGPCALYLRPRAGLDAWRDAARARRVTVSSVRRGPLGRSVLVPGDGIAGPHVIVVHDPGPSYGRVPAGTINA